MKLHTELHQKSWCRFAFHKTSLDLVQTAVEAVVFGHRALSKRTASPFIRI